MTAVTDETAAEGSKPADVVGEQLARQLVEQARSQGVDLVGPEGLLRRVTKLVIEGALEGELTDHLGYGRHDQVGKDGGNSRNGETQLATLPPYPVKDQPSVDGARNAQRGDQPCSNRCWACRS
jgi:hypothetical protein